MGETRAVIGATDHIGWAELVTLGSRAGAPILLDRRRVELVDARLPSAPYHHECLELDLEPAIDLVDRVRASVAECSRATLSRMREEHRAGALILPTSPFERCPESLEEVLRSRRLTMAADGMMYREALAEAAASLGMAVHRYPRKSDPAALAAEALGIDGAGVASLVAALGREAGAPWRHVHRQAAAAALVVLAPALRR